jgi:hypothetical protein
MSKKLNWAEIPQKYQYLTKDESGQWYFHVEHPVMDLIENVWFSDDMYRAYWLFGKRPKLEWQDSLKNRICKAVSRKPTVNWSLVPAHFDWIATDEDGETFAFSDRPTAEDSFKGCGYWSVDDSVRHLWIGHEGYKFRLGTCEWKSTLIERPNRATRLKPSINWEVVPDKYRWLATDENGESWLYQNKPEIHNDRWIDPTGAGCCPVTKRDDMFVGKLPWYDSVVERVG